MKELQEIIKVKSHKIIKCPICKGTGIQKECKCWACLGVGITIK